MGIMSTSGGIGKKELSIKLMAAKYHKAWGWPLSEITLLYVFLSI
jgi:hypothetical protein